MSLLLFLHGCVKQMHTDELVKRGVTPVPERHERRVENLHGAVEPRQLAVHLGEGTAEGAVRG
jgi:hypothetical protein